jgi:hypothetical protein
MDAGMRSGSEGPVPGVMGTILGKQRAGQVRGD